MRLHLYTSIVVCSNLSAVTNGETAWDCICKAWRLTHILPRHWNCKHARRLLDSNSAHVGLSNAPWLFLSFIPPSAFGPTLQQCIARQGLDTFYRLYRSVKWLCPPLLPLRQKGAKVTIFAPNDSAFESIALENLTTSAVCQLLSNHIVFERVDAKHLLSTKRLQAPTRLRLYANTVQYYFPLMDAVGRQVIRKVLLLTNTTCIVSV